MANAFELNLPFISKVPFDFRQDRLIHHCMNCNIKNKFISLLECSHFLQWPSLFGSSCQMAVRPDCMVLY